MKSKANLNTIGSQLA